MLTYHFICPNSSYYDRPIINNLIADNQANISGAGLYFRGGKTTLVHNTIALNSGGDGSGVYLAYEGPPFGSGVRVSLTNTIIVSQTVGITVEVGSTATLESTLWNGNATNWGGGGAVSASNSYTGTPAFVNPTSGNYHIGPGSAALDKGINAGVISDIDGESRPQGVGFDLGADEYFSSPMLSIQKAGPPTATASSPITFTLTITNTGPVSATNLVITDTIPVGAYYINGGVKVGNVVSWTIPGLAANGGVTQSTFVVTATQTITNDDYAVSAEGGYTVKGNSVVITVLSPEGDTSRQYLPVIWKQ